MRGTERRRERKREREGWRERNKNKIWRGRKRRRRKESLKGRVKEEKGQGGRRSVLYILAITFS